MDNLDFESVVENLPHMVWFTGPDGVPEYCNRCMRDYFGWLSGDVPEIDWLQIVHPADREHSNAIWREAVDKGRDYRIEYRLRRAADGVFLWHEGCATPVRGANGEVVRWVGTCTDIDGRKRADERLRNAESKYRALFGSMRDAFVSVAMDGRIEDFNPAYLEILGYTAEELRTTTYVDLTPEKWHEHEALIVAEQILPRGYSDVYEKEYRRKDGTIVPVELRTFLVRDHAGDPAMMWAIVRDISERKRLETHLLASEERFRSLMDLSPDIISIVTPDGTLAYNSPAALAVHGYTQEEMIGRNTFGLIHPEDQPRCTAYVDNLFNHCPGPRSVRYRYRNKDGSYVWMEATASNHFDNPYVRGLIVISRDISERKRTEEALEAARRELEREHDVLKAVMDGAKNSHLVYLDRDFNFVHVNETYARTCGYPAEEMIGKNHFALYPHAENEAIFTRVRDTGEAVSIHDKPFEFPDQPERGVTYWDWSLTPAKDATGSVVGLVFSLFETTVRKRAEEELRLSEEKFAKAFRNSPLLMTLSDLDTGRYLEVNKMFSRISGFTQEEAVGRTSVELGWITAQQRQALADEIRVKGQLSGVEMQLHGKSGGAVWCQYFGELISTGSGPMVLSIAKDITESKAVEVALKRAREEAEAANRAKSEFLANMSHEIRTPITGILGMAELLENTELNTAQTGFLTTILRSTENLLDLVNDILDLSKIEAGKAEVMRKKFRIRDLISDVVNNQRPLFEAKGLACRTIISPDVPTASSGDILKLKQILLNLLGNAVKFTERGEVSVSVAVEERLGNSVTLLFEVSDSGIGIYPEHLKIIFEPFRQSDSSTARKYGGTGLGLTICSRLLGLMGGRIQVESRVGSGSTFRIWVPLSPVEGDIEEMVRDALPRPTRPGLSILLAEDSDASRLFFVEALQKQGFCVEVVQNGVEALVKWGEGAYDLILMDIQMPVMDGVTALAKIREAEKIKGGHVPVIAVTAHALLEDRKTFLAQGFDGYLAKPTKIRDLLAEIERCHPLGVVVSVSRT